MPQLIQNKTQFNSGQLSPSLLGRVDTEAYAAGASELTNVIPKIQGGVKARRVFRIRNITGDYNPNKMIPFVHSKGDTAMIEMATPNIFIWHMKGITPDSSVPSASIKSPYSPEESRKLKYIQQYDTVFLIHPDHPPKRIVRSGTPGLYSWKIENVPFTKMPQKDGVDAWGVNNYPTVIALFEGRLYIGATKKHPNIIWGSKVGNPFDFSNTDDKLADESVEIELGGHGSVSIQHLFPQRVLFAFTDNGVYTTVESPVTPAKAVMIRNAESGIAPDIPPVEMGQSLMFMKKDTTADMVSLYEAQYDDNSKQFIMTDLAVLADNVIKNPVGMAVVNSTDDTGSHTAYVLNDDNTIAVLTYMRDEKVRAWSVWKLNDKDINDIVSLDGNLFLSTAFKTHDDSTGYHLEALDPPDTHILNQIPMDNWIMTDKVGGSSDVWRWRGGVGGLYQIHKNGNMVDVVGRKGDKKTYLGKYKVQGNHDRVVGIPYADYDYVYVGFVFDWVVSTMPHYAAVYEKTTNNRRFRVLKTTVRMQNIKRLAVNGASIQLLDMDALNFGTPAPPYSGVKTILHSGYIDINDTNAKTTFTGDSIGGGEIMNVETVIKI